MIFHWNYTFCIANTTLPLGCTSFGNQVHHLLHLVKTSLYLTSPTCLITPEKSISKLTETGVALAVASLHHEFFNLLDLRLLL
jgi:hypothetical protein